MKSYISVERFHVDCPPEVSPEISRVNTENANFDSVLLKRLGYKGSRVIQEVPLAGNSMLSNDIPEVKYKDSDQF
ncbi:MAG TPA: hypothetical protein VF350_01745 [Candidatus Bathyarchaeia archaeon]